MCDFSEFAMECSWLCKSESSGLARLNFQSATTGCERSGFLDCLDDAPFDNNCYIASGCNSDLKFGSALYCLQEQPGVEACLSDNGLI